MKFHFKNLGPIYDGSIEIKDLTVLCGLNNTGKTYITNTIYSFLYNWSALLEWEIPEEIIQELQEQNFTSIVDPE